MVLHVFPVTREIRDQINFVYVLTEKPALYVVFGSSEQPAIEFCNTKEVLSQLRYIRTSAYELQCTHYLSLYSKGFLFSF